MEELKVMDEPRVEAAKGVHCRGCHEEDDFNESDGFCCAPLHNGGVTAKS